MIKYFTDKSMGETRFRQDLFSKKNSVLASKFITLLILVNFILTIFALDPDYNYILAPFIANYEVGLDIIFILEMIVRISKRKSTFFYGHNEYVFWNYFDLTITMVCITTTFFANFVDLVTFKLLSSLSFDSSLIVNFRILRIIRIFRLLRLVSAFDGIKKIMSSLVSAIPRIISIFILLLIIYSLYSVIGCRVYGSLFYEYFGSFEKSMFTLFQLMTLESWTAVVRPIMKVFPYSWIYFISFICITAYILLNAVTSIFVDIMQKKASETEDEGIEHIDEIKEIKDSLNEIKKMLEKK